MVTKQISLDDRPEKKAVKILMVVFGILCIATAGWWAAYLIRGADVQKVFWLATIFLFLFGLYQVYAGLGLAKRYIFLGDDQIIIRQDALLPGKMIIKDDITGIAIGNNDIIVSHGENRRFRLKLGLRYPDLGHSIKEEFVKYAEGNSLELTYKNKHL